MQIEIYKTNIYTETDACRVIEMVKTKFPEAKVNCDLQDCDKVLRIEGFYLNSQLIIDIVKKNGFLCEELL